jgi:phosphoribosylamine---glycine ligase
MNVLLLGGGGREHAMAWKIAESPLCSKLFIAPGNPGTSRWGENVPLKLNDFPSIREFVKAREVRLVVVGPEEPLVKGIADFLSRDESLGNLLFVGPPAAGAKLEGSKAFAKAFMMRHGIPTAAYRSFTRETLDKAKAFLQTMAAPYVLKADGLAAGKGVIICDSLTEANETLDEMLCGEMFGQASATVVVEEFLKGREVSVFAVTDGDNYILLPSAKDYKRIGEGDSGPNTGGMGAVSPVPFAGKAFMEKVESRIVRPTVSGLKKEGIPYCGFIFFGLIEVKGEPFVIEYNVRLGDPEAEAILPRISSDFLELLIAAGNKALNKYSMSVDTRHAATVVLASGGYPGNYETGFNLLNLEMVEKSLVFFAGVREEGMALKTSGGRVLAITSLGNDTAKALQASYESARIIDFRGKYCRYDIGRDLLP